MTREEYYEEKHKKVENWLTPTEEEQVFRILKGECPHNKGWKYYSGGHNDDAYTCCLCGEMDFY